jgi:hypothetical protein
LPAARYRSFGRIQLDWKNHDTFIALLDSPYVTFPPYVRELSIGTEWSLTLPMEWLNKVLSVMSGFVNMTPLYICSFCWSHLEDEALSTLKSFPSLTHLELRDCEFDNFDQMVDLISSYSKTLNQLELFDSEWGSPNTPLIQLPSPPSLKDLQLVFDTCDHLFDSLLLHEAAYMDMHTLVITLSCPEDMGNVSKLLG